MRKQKIKKPSSKYATIIAPLKSDIMLMLNWAKLNKTVKSIGDVREIGQGYAVSVKLKSGIKKSDLKNLLSDKFGSFVRKVV
tara:strand:+ start:4738 stop:4983 length:246 start_codon:yes stop_codon:yes gene_type:complete